MLSFIGLTAALHMDKKKKLLPWFVPKASPAFAVLVRNLGHKVVHSRGDILYDSEKIFERLMYVQSGIAAKAVFLPGFETPFFLSLALPGSLIGCIDTIYAKDLLPRRHWAVSNCELLTVPKELMLKLADHEVEWHKQLASYNAYSNLSDRMGLMTSRASDSERRLGVFLVSFCNRSNASILEELEDIKKEWIVLSSLPPRRLIAQVIGCEVELVDRILLSWIHEGTFKKIHRNLLIRREKLLDDWNWLSRFG